MYARWAALFLGVTGGLLILWGLISLPLPAALLIAGTLLTCAAAVLHLRSSPAQHSHPQMPSAMVALLALMRGGAPGRAEPADEAGPEKPEVQVSAEPPALEEAVAQPGTPDVEGALAKVQGHPPRAGRGPVVRATATTYQEGAETATHKVRVRISGRRAP